jgi:asparagine synthase (glutamine-hydrolysing)
MCGIAAQLRFPVADISAVRRMTDVQAHRGPDGEGFHSDGPIALGHRRLSIIDLSGGAQPIFNEDRSVAVILNGEIYNYRELAAELRGRHQLQTASDTEVLVHLYEDHGPDMLRYLRGMFAFALWDSKKQRLFAARDRFGKKPLLYARTNDTLWLASELAALAAGGASLGSLDLQALNEYLALLYVPAPRTIWSNARKLPAGHYFLADARGLEVRRYWSPPIPGASPVAPSDAAPRTRRLLEESVRLRLRSDVPVGVLLSGGIDSSVVTALAAQEGHGGLTTFSVGFGRKDDELPLARELARRVGAEHHEIAVRENIAIATTRALAMFSEPFGDSSAVPCAEVFREVARHVKVVLTGDGGDELFSGYGRYRQVQALPFVPLATLLARPFERLRAGRRGQQLLRLARVLGRRRGARYQALIEVFSPDERRRLMGLASQEVRVTSGGRSNPDAAIAFDLSTYLPEDLLTKTDITSMASSLEARCPLLDHELGEWVIPMPIGRKQDRHRGKIVLEEATRDLVGAEVFRRPKRGFGSPVAEWFQGPLRELAVDTVLSQNSHVRQWLDPASVATIGEAVLEGRGNAHQLWALLALEQWLDTRGYK